MESEYDPVVEPVAENLGKTVDEIKGIAADLRNVDRSNVDDLLTEAVDRMTSSNLTRSIG